MKEEREKQFRCGVDDSYGRYLDRLSLKFQNYVIVRTPSHADFFLHSNLVPMQTICAGTRRLVIFMLIPCKQKKNLKFWYKLWLSSAETLI